MTGDVQELYQNRFRELALARKNAIWKILCDEFFSRYVSPDAKGVDVGAGYCEFINNISAAHKVAIDLTHDTPHHASPGVEVVHNDASAMSAIADDSVDVVFMSNFLEHLPDKRAVLSVLEQCRFCLKPAGRLLVLQPNIRYVGAAYWDYIDHHVALTERSLVEALELNGFEVKRLIRRFLPYTAKSRVGRLANLLRPALLIRAYLKLPFLWRVFGGQTFVEAQRADTTGQHERITSEGNSG